MNTKNDENDRLTRDEILGAILEYGLYATCAVAFGLVASMFVRAFLQ